MLNFVLLVYVLKILYKNVFKIFFKGYSNKKIVNEVKWIVIKIFFLEKLIGIIFIYFLKENLNVKI